MRYSVCYVYDNTIIVISVMSFNKQLHKQHLKEE
jgi:hypothetical protein